MFTTRTIAVVGWVTFATTLFSLIYLITSAITPPQSLEEAIKAGKVDVNVHSNDSRSYSNVYITVKNLSSNSQRILVPAGTLYTPDEDDEQELIQLNDEILVIKPKEENTFEIKTYCTEAHDRSPDGSFSLNVNKNEKFKTLISYVQNNPGITAGLQDAVWAISDNENINNVPGGSETQNSFREFLSGVTGQENSWYSSPQQYDVDPYGNINRETVNITGDLEFTASRAMRVHEEIQDGNGETLIKSDRSFQLRGGNVKYQFAIRVKGWEKGTYFVKVLNEESEELVVREFQV